ncbi:MAG: sodium ion-translocating decarboxylase subunit beta, partial [Clostridia bacterium]|nr:sodium ion-translocating decarboxylase subunit beta [Clostridia bacterium]
MFKLKKVNCKRALACLLVLFSLLTVWAYAESAADNYVPRESVDMEEVDAIVAEKAAEGSDPEIDIVGSLKKIVNNTGFAQGEWRQYAMIAVACLLLYLAIVKQFEPLLLLPIAFGMLLANLPAAGLMSHPHFSFYDTLQEAVVQAKALGKDTSDIIWRFDEAAGVMRYSLQTANGGLLYYLYHGVKWGI